jgi:hypothetical protein
VEDANFEETQIRTEALEDLATAQLQQLVQTNPEALTGILRDVRQGVLVEDAIDNAHRKMQQVQASSGPPGTPEGPAEPGSPETQPGIGVPGGGGQAPPQIAAPPPDVKNLVAQMIASRRPAAQGATEKAAV